MKASYGRVQHGIGTYRLPSGVTRYRVVLRHGAKTITKSGFTTQGAAKAWQRKTLNALDSGTHVTAAHGRATLGAYAEDWLAGANVKAKTRSLYTSLYNCHIRHTLGSLRFRDLDRQDVRAWYRKLQAKDSIGPTTTAKVYKLLRQILDDAVEDGYLPANPCKIKGAAVEHSQERPAPSPDVVWQLADAVPARLRTLILVAGFGGLRQGELFALRKCDVDAAGRAVVARQADEKTGAIVDYTKTAAGRRTVSLPAVVASALLDHCATVPSPDGLLWPARQRSGKVSPLRGSNFRRSVWAPACKKVGVAGLHFHDLRHTAGTLNAEAGVSLKVNMAQLGHRSTAAALRYQHAAQPAQDAAAAAVDQLIAPASNVVPLRPAKAAR